MPKKTVELTPLPNKKVLFTLREDEKIKANYEFNPKVLKSQQQVSREAGVPVETLLAWIAEVATFPKTFDLSGPVSDGFRVWYRPLTSPRGDHTDFTSVAKFLDNLSGDRETIVEWDDTQALGCLDVDYHGDNVPSQEWLDTTASTSLLPKPYVWHLTPRGLHAFYPAVAGLTGEEVAAVAALRWRTLDPTAGVELKRQLRCPGAATLRKAVSYESLATFVNDFLGASGDVDPSSWLEANGLEIGRRYPHDQCPIEPTVASDNRDPVVVSDSGVFCHRCAGLGRQKGRNRAGYVPFSSLIGNSGSGILGTLVRRKTHWGHAQHVLDAYLGITGDMARLAYRAALKLFHGEDVSGVFRPETSTLVRMDGRWATVNEGYTFPKDIQPLLGILPACQFDDGKPNPAQVCLFSQPTLDLTDLGYPSVQVIRGAKVSTRVLGTSRLVVSSPAPWLKEYGSVFFPRYVVPAARMPEGECWSVIESVFPKVNRLYLKTLIIARGCNEAQVGLPQHLVVDGVTSAGKTAHVQIAASVLGDVVTAVPACPDTDRFRSAVRDASERGSFVGFDEFLKDSMRLNPKMTPEQVLDPLLNFDPNGLSHKLYVGPTPLGRIGVCVWSETNIPNVLRDHAQIARRVHHIRLLNQVEWDGTLAAHGISEIKFFRTISQDHAHACNSLVSWISDEYFTSLLTFHDYCRILGVPTLERSEEFEDPTVKLREFFKLVCDAPPLDPTDSKRWPGKGYKLIVRGADDQLSEAWELFSDGGKQWHEARRIREKPFNKILGVDEPVVCDIQAHGHRLAIRFRQGSMKAPTAVNEEIK